MVVKGVGREVKLNLFGSGFDRIQTFNFDNSEYKQICQTVSKAILDSNTYTVQVTMEPWAGGGWFNISSITIEKTSQQVQNPAPSK